MKNVAVIGGGPAGLKAAEIIATAGHRVTVYDHMSSVGRKFLMAGRGGLNLTHSEDLDVFVTRYGAAASWLEPVIRDFPPEALRGWCHGLGQETFVGSSGRVFPKSLRASPLLRAWLRRLDALGVGFALKRQWTGWDEQKQLTFSTSEGDTETVAADAALLALGGASWPRFGSDGGWVEILRRQHIPLAPLRPANCGFVVPWSDLFRERFEGQPLKPVMLSFGDKALQGEVMITAKGIEGGVVYALSAGLRDEIELNGKAMLSVDLRLGLSLAELTKRLEAPRGSQSLSNFLRKFVGLPSVAVSLIYETAPKDLLQKATPQELATMIKACPLRLTATSGIDRAISTAGGIRREALDESFMIRNLPGVFAAGEMLDWEAPTGGYLLQASFSTAVAAAKGMLRWLENTKA